MTFFNINRQRCDRRAHHFFQLTRFYALVCSLSLIFGKFVLCDAAIPSVTTDPATSTKQVSVVERDFLAAKDAYDRRDAAALTAARDKFASRKDFVLAPYVNFWWLSTSLNAGAQNAQTVKSLAPEIEKFTSDFPDAPFADQLRRDYLRALAKLELWSAFAANQARYTGDDIEVGCQRLRYRLQANDRLAISAALTDAKIFWQINKTTAEPCFQLFERLRTEKIISNDDIWRRVRALLESGQLAEARRSAQLIPNVPRTFEAETASANLDPKRFLAKHVTTPNDPAAAELALFAFAKLARSNADAAATWLDLNESHLKKTDAQYAWAELGYLGALQQEHDALAWFKRAGDGALNDTQAAWLVRAALREIAKDTTQWTTIKRAINMMSETEKRESSWRYWLARAHLALGDATSARALREPLARENHFYGVLAAEEIGLSLAPNFAGFQPGEMDINEVTNRPAAKRAFLLYQLDLRNEGLREWQALIRNMDDKTLLAAAEAARRQALPDRAINTAERTQTLHDFGQRYPLPHRDLLQARAKDHALDEAWVFGLIRQESRFIADAKSSAGALGLMQLMPSTAKWVAKQIGLKDFSNAHVIDVPVNLSLGSFYLRHVLDDLGHPVLATAAYNAGPGRARRWRAESPLEGAIYAESIPFNETRDYVKKVMVNKWFYMYRLYGKSPRLSEIMGLVPGKASRRPATTLAATIDTVMDVKAITETAIPINPSAEITKSP